MNRPRTLHLAAAIAIAMLLASCGSDPDRPLPIPNSASTPNPTSNAETVITTALTRLFTWFPAQEPDTTAAFDRARPLLGPPLIDADGPGAPLTRSIEWGQWAAQGVSVVATAQIVSDEHPPDTPTSVARVVKVTQRPTVVNGGSQPPKVLTAWAIATSRSPGMWVVTSIRI